MLPHLLGYDGVHGEEQRPSLPSIRDLFGEHLAQPLNKRSSPFSLADLSFSLPAESRPTSPAENQGSLFSSSLISPRSVLSLPVNRKSSINSSEAAYLTRHHSDVDSYGLTTPSTPSNHERLSTLPFIYPSDNSYHDRHVPNTYMMSCSRRMPESHSRSRSTSEAVRSIQDSPAHQFALDTAAKRRHTIGSSRGHSPMPYHREPRSSEHRNSDLTGLPTTSRPTVMSMYPAPSTHPSLPRAPPRVMDSSPPPSCPSPPSTTSGDEAPTERKKTLAKYLCEYCGKRFNRPSSLKIHHNTHTGEKPYACSFPGCGRHFSVMSNMRRHARIHGDFPSFSPHERSFEEVLDTSSTVYPSSTHSTPILQQAAIMPALYSRSHPSSATSSPHRPVMSLPSSSRPQSHRRQSSVARPHPYTYRRSRSPSSDEGNMSPER